MTDSDASSDESGDERQTRPAASGSDSDGDSDDDRPKGRGINRVVPILCSKGKMLTKSRMLKNMVLLATSGKFRLFISRLKYFIFKN